MRQTFQILIMFIFPVFLHAQNLFDNPGFEQGLTGWETMYNRAPSTGTAQTVNSPVHSGLKSCRITHSGKEDWSFKHTGSISVKPGEIYEFSAYFNVAAKGDWLHMSFALFDAAGNAIDWDYLPVDVNITQGTFVKLSERIAIPAGAVSMWPRFIGGGNCDLFIDDVDVRPAGSVGTGRKYYMNSSRFSVEITSPSFEMNITDNDCSKKYYVSPVSGFQVLSADSLKDEFLFHASLISTNDAVDIKISLTSEGLKFSLIPVNNPVLTAPLMFPGYIDSKSGDFLIVPRAGGVMIPSEENYPFGNYTMYAWKSTMAFAGVTDLSTGYMLVSDDPWDTQLKIFKPSGSGYTSMQMGHLASKDSLSYARTFYLNFISKDGYSSMAKTYRSHAETLGYVRTFDDKMRENPNVEKLRGAVNFWALNGWFRSTAFIDSLKLSGIDRAIFSLGGSWIDPLNMSALIDSINSRGMLSSRYDIFTDVFPPLNPPASGYRTEGYPQDVIVDKDGGLHKGWLAYLNNGQTPYQGYYTCSATHKAYSDKYTQADLQKNRYNCRFIDVETASELFECYSPQHPTSRKDDALYRTDLFKQLKTKYNLVIGSEEAREWTFPYSDYGEGTMTIVPALNAGYDWSSPLTDPGSDFINYSMNAAKRIPLYGLVYHDVHVPTWYTGDGMSKVPAYWDKKDLFNILYASMPLVMPPDQSYWLANKEKFITSMNLVSAVFRRCGFAKLTKHEFLSNDRLVQKTTFDNGWTVVCNFSSSDYNYNGLALPPNGFYATDGSESVYRIKEGAAVTASVQLNDRIFIQPYNAEFSRKGIRSRSAIIMMKSADKFNLTFIGNQDYADIKPDEFPWPVKNITVKTRTGSVPVALEKLTEGWLRLKKQSNEIFYTITSDSLTSGINGAGSEKIRFSLEQNYPNPFNPVTTIRYSIAEPSMVKLKIYDLLGREKAVLLDEFKPAGHYSVQFDGSSLPSGVYTYKLQSGALNETKKLLLVK